jgi:hypothetical protein
MAKRFLLVVALAADACSGSDGGSVPKAQQVEVTGGSAGAGGVGGAPAGSGGMAAVGGSGGNGGAPSSVCCLLLSQSFGGSVSTSCGCTEESVIEAQTGRTCQQEAEANSTTTVLGVLVTYTVVPGCY